MRWIVHVIAAAALAAGLHAAVLRGTVVEAQTGKALARTLVAVHPVTGTAGATRSVRTNSYGVFDFSPIVAGTYVVSAAHKGFAPIQYGQKEWKGSGTAVIVQDSEETVLRIAMPRFGAITGRISDEADVGLVEHDVIAYRNTRPPVMVGKAATDDRGMYRIAGLEPGSYVVRAGAKQYDEGGGYLPTFYKETPVVDVAYAVDVKLDRDTPDVNIRALPGRLYTIAGRVAATGTPPQTWTVSLISDLGVDQVTTDPYGQFHFLPAAPGKYELLAQSPRGAGWTAIEIDRDRSDIRISGLPIPVVEFAFEDGKGGTVDASGLQLMARQKELWGPGAVQYLQLAGNRATLQPGRWQFEVAPNASYYMRGWADATITFSTPGPLVRLTVLPNPGAVHGTVSSAAGEPAAGAPVYLERGGEVRNTRSDIHGVYSFAGLAPGEYRIVFASDAAVIQVAEGQDTAADIKLGSASGK